MIGLLGDIRQVLQEKTAVSSVWIQPSTPERIAPAVQKALDWLDAHPNRDGLSYRAAASAAGVSLATMQRAIRLHEIKQ